MEITRREMRALTTALREWGHEAGVDIYTTNDIAAAVNGAAYEWGVNWSAQGTKSPNETRDFAKVLVAAAEIAEELNAIAITETDEFERIANREQYTSTVKIMFHEIDKAQNKARALRDAIELLPIREKIYSI